MRANYQRHVRRFIGLLLACIMSTFCAGVNRENRVTISADGEIAYPAQKQTYGCENPTTYIQKDRQIGGTAKVRYESQNGLVVESEAGVAAGVVIEANFDGAKGRRYVQEVIGARIGYDLKYFGFDAGAKGVFNNLGPGTWFPRVNIRGGLLDTVWGEIGTDAAQDRLGGTLIGGGVGFDTSIVSGRGGAGVLVRPLTDFIPKNTRSVIWSLPDEALSVSGYANLTFHLPAGFGLTIGGIIGKAPSVTAGLSYSF